MNFECLKISFDCNLNITYIPCENNRRLMILTIRSKWNKWRKDENNLLQYYTLH